MCEKGRKGVSGERMLVAMEINPSHALKVAMETEIKTQSVLSQILNYESSSTFTPHWVILVYKCFFLFSFLQRTVY